MSEKNQFAVLRQDLVVRTGQHLQRGTVKRQPRTSDRFQCLITFPNGETGVLSVEESVVKAYPEIFEMREKPE